MKILGIDPSLSSTGWAIIEDEKLDWFSSIKTKPKTGFIKRLESIRCEFKHLIRHSQFKNIDYFALEDVFVNRRNMKTPIQLAKVHGIILATILSQWHPSQIKVYTPSFVKQVVTGSGRADKEQVMKMVKLQTDYKGNSDDEADAIAVALTCHRDITQGLR
jgi:crossover junction endodeoxyribonuclease RuvC